MAFPSRVSQASQYHIQAPFVLPQLLRPAGYRSCGFGENGHLDYITCVLWSEVGDKERVCRYYS